MGRLTQRTYTNPKQISDMSMIAMWRVEDDKSVAYYRYDQWDISVQFTPKERPIAAGDAVVCRRGEAKVIAVHEPTKKAWITLAGGNANPFTHPLWDLLLDDDV